MDGLIGVTQNGFLLLANGLFAIFEAEKRSNSLQEAQIAQNKIETVELPAATDFVEVEIARGRTPIYRDPRERAAGRPPLQDWQAGVCRARAAVR